jgi:hypothetical protein
VREVAITWRRGRARERALRAATSQKAEGLAGVNRASAAACTHPVALLDEALGQKLAKVSKTHDP